MSEELRSCPFCGAEAESGEQYSLGGGTFYGYSVGCVTEDCIALYPIDYFFDSQKDAIKAWNNRAAKGDKSNE